MFFSSIFLKIDCELDFCNQFHKKDLYHFQMPFLSLQLYVPIGMLFPRIQNILLQIFCTWYFQNLHAYREIAFFLFVKSTPKIMHPPPHSWYANLFQTKTIWEGIIRWIIFMWRKAPWVSIFGIIFLLISIATASQLIISKCLFAHFLSLILASGNDSRKSGTYTFPNSM